MSVVCVLWLLFFSCVALARTTTGEDARSLGLRDLEGLCLSSEVVGAASDWAGDADMDLCMAIPGVLDRSSVPNDDSGEADLTLCST